MEKLNGKKINIAVFISGRGSNLKSLIKHYKKKKSTISIKLVISNNLNANGLIYAKQAKIKSYVLNFKDEAPLPKLFVK